MPGGVLLVSVPDLTVLGRLFAETRGLKTQFKLMRVVFGGHIDTNDFHKSGFSLQILIALLHNAGFCAINRVRSFGLFNDSSELEIAGTPVSLNLVARTGCGTAGIVEVDLPTLVPWP